MPGYVYRGSEFDAHLPIDPKPAKPRKPYTRSASVPEVVCGTRSGYAKHRRFNEKPCQDCNDANNSYLRDYKERVKARKVGTGWTTAKCGTMAGYSGHLRHAVPVCDLCRVAKNVYAQNNRRAA